MGSYPYSILFRKGHNMPGELGNEEESQNVGYYEHRSTQTDEFMKSRVDSVPTDGDKKLQEDQASRLLRNFKKNLGSFKPTE